ncbi:NADPH:quinone oxidoreductase family protein [Nocardia carnea]|uniref:NADPH:quinone oxidoreductase family protein n=1 Tax=Nocardia carnea TaxID=37328 RepID=UPI002457C4DA|nr:NADPH:quinone oxidoreductase family protein [Nocardia carnea]
MRAMQISDLGGPDALELVELPDPVAAPGKVLIEVQAAGVSFVDLLMTQGLYQDKPDLPFVPGIEVAGFVRSAPADTGYRVGDRVAAYVPNGGYAEVVAAAPEVTMALPAELGFDQGAAIAMNFQTVHFALARRGRLQQGEHVLVHGAAGGIGTAAIQVAKGLGAQVTAVVDTEANIDVAKTAGADNVVAIGDGWAETVAQSGPVNVTVDPVGGDFFTDSLRLLAPEGRHLVIGFAAGGIPQVKVNRLLLKNIEVVGVGWGAFLAVDQTIAAASAAELDRLARAGFIRPIVGATYPLERAAEALCALRDRTAAGKLVIEVGNVVNSR